MLKKHDVATQMPKKALRDFRGREALHFKSANEAWFSLLMLTDYAGDLTGPITSRNSVGSHFGKSPRATKEILALKFSLEDPRNRVLFSSLRPFDLGYAIANVIWTVAGRDDAESISFYNALGSRFSDDGIKIPSAMGPRAFSKGAGNQWEHAADQLRDDPSTRRAVVQVLTASDLLEPTRDCSCVESIQFFVRDEYLHCLVVMRSQSALMVLPYDLFLFTMLHEAMAVKIGMKLGTFYHFSGSLHYYEDEFETVESVIRSGIPQKTRPMIPMQSSNQDTFRRLSEAEKAIRTSLTRSPERPISFGEFGLDEYWCMLLRSMTAGVRIRRDIPLPKEEEKFIPRSCIDILALRKGITQRGR